MNDECSALLKKFFKERR